MTKYIPRSHSFDHHVAITVGLNAAIVFNHIVGWIIWNKKESKNQHEGRTWMYQTMQQISDYLEFLSFKQVRLAIASLVENGYLVEGNFNKNMFDRTIWYAIADEELIEIKKENTKCPTGQMHVAPRANENAPQGNTYNEHSSKHTNIKRTYVEKPVRSHFSNEKEKEEIETLILYALSQNAKWKIEPDIAKRWIKKYSIDVVIEAIKYLSDNARKPENFEAYMEGTLAKGYAGQKEKIAKIKELAIKLKKKHNLKWLTVRPKHWYDEETGENYSLLRERNQFIEELIHVMDKKELDITNVCDLFEE